MIGGQEMGQGRIPSFDGVQIDFEVCGQGRTGAVFVHGWSCNRHFWDTQLAETAKRCCSVGIDLAGHGGSSDGRLNYTLDSFAEDVVSVANHLALKNIVLVGHSMGGGVALEAARKLDGEVKRVVVVDTFVFDYGQFSPDEVRVFLDTFDTDYVGAVRDLVAQTCKPGTASAFIDEIAGEMARTPKSVGLAALEGLLSWDPEPVWEDIGAPVTCINGDMINDNARKRHAGHFEEIRLPGTGHFLHMEMPEAFNRLLAEVLQRT